VATVAVTGWHCSSDAIAVEACRTIENKRCEAAMGCTSGIADEDDVTACQLFYRDQCLFGMAAEEDPGQPAVEACVAAIDQAAVCKLSTMTDCAQPPALSDSDAWDKSGCTIILNPELLADCAFLLPADSGEGGGGEGGSSSGTGGSGGSAGSGGSVGGAGGAGGAGVN